MGRGARIGCGVVTAALFGTAGVGVYNVLHAVSGGSGGGAHTVRAAEVSDTPPGAADAVTFARGFLGSWAAGPSHYAGAASDTDSPSAAEAALLDYRKGLDPQSLSFGGLRADGLQPGDPRARRVRFTVTVRTGGHSWSYDDALGVVQSGSGQKAVSWSDAVLYPKLQSGQTLRVGALPLSSGTRAVASDGRTPLAGDRYPSLTDIAATVARSAGGTATGTGGLGVRVVGADGSTAWVAKTFRAPRPHNVVTTIDAHVQDLAERAVRDPHNAGRTTSAVVLDWRTGHILAIAYRGSNDDAINATTPPGSTMKIITSAALFDKAGLSPGSAAPCPDTQVEEGQLFHNEPDVRPRADGTVEYAFTVSCNTAFAKAGTKYLNHGADASALHDEATAVFGWGSWSIGGGVATTDPSVPADPRGGDMAAQFIGQGLVTATPLVMASVAATVRDGAFHQPVLVPHGGLTTAARPITAGTAGALRAMMAATARYGTAAPRLASLPGVGAKTGTAEEAQRNDGWLTAYDGRYAVASMVEGARSGVDSAGWIVRDVLTGTG